MGFFKRIAGILRFVKDDLHGGADDASKGEEGGRMANDVRRRGMKGIGVKVPVAANRTSFMPVLIPCNLGEGGVQGLGWYARRFRIDEDGDVADEFLNEISLPGNQTTQSPVKFEVKYITKPAAIKNQTISTDGNIHQSLCTKAEHSGCEGSYVH